MCKQLLKQANTLDHCSSDIQCHVEDQRFVLTFLKATMRIMLVTNTAIPPMRENKANTISALRTEKKKAQGQARILCKKLVYDYLLVTSIFCLYYQSFII